MFLPVGDDNRRSSIPAVNYLLILANIGVSWYVASLPQMISLETYALVPARPTPLAFVTSMFLHAGLLHLLGNMLILWVVGDNVEDRFGHGMFLVFYFLCGLVASTAHIIWVPATMRLVPTVGASGAISGIMGAYLILFPRAPIKLLLAPFPIIIRVRAFAVFGIWIAMQLLVATSRDSGGKEPDMVAYWAHIGGFAFGAGVTLILRMLNFVQSGNYLPPKSEHA